MSKKAIIAWVISLISIATVGTVILVNIPDKTTDSQDSAEQVNQKDESKKNNETYDGLKDVKKDDKNQDKKDDKKDTPSNVIQNVINNVNNSNQDNNQKPQAPVVTPDEPNNEPDEQPEDTVITPSITLTVNESKKVVPSFTTKLVIKNADDVVRIAYAVSESSDMNLSAANWVQTSNNQEITLSDIDGARYIWVKVTLSDGSIVTYCSGKINLRNYYSTTPTFSPNTVVSEPTDKVKVKYSFENMVDIDKVEYSIQNTNAVNSNVTWSVANKKQIEISATSATATEKYLWLKVTRVDGREFLYSSGKYVLKNTSIPDMSFNSSEGTLSYRNIEIVLNSIGDAKDIKYVIVDDTITESQYDSFRDSDYTSLGALTTTSKIANVQDVIGNMKVLVKYTLKNNKVGYILSDEAFAMRKYDVALKLDNEISSTPVSKYTVSVSEQNSVNDVSKIEYYISAVPYASNISSDVSWVNKATTESMDLTYANNGNQCYVWMRATNRYNDAQTITCSSVIKLRDYVAPTIALNSSESVLGTSADRVYQATLKYDISNIDDLLKLEYKVVDANDTSAVENDWAEATVSDDGVATITKEFETLADAKVIVRALYGVDSYTSEVETDVYLRDVDESISVSNLGSYSASNTSFTALLAIGEDIDSDEVYYVIGTTEVDPDSVNYDSAQRYSAVDGITVNNVGANYIYVKYVTLYNGEKTEKFGSYTLIPASETLINVTLGAVSCTGSAPIPSPIPGLDTRKYNVLLNISLTNKHDDSTYEYTIYDSSDNQVQASREVGPTNGFIMSYADVTVGVETTYKISIKETKADTTIVNTDKMVNVTFEEWVAP